MGQALSEDVRFAIGLVQRALHARITAPCQASATWRALLGRLEITYLCDKFVPVHICVTSLYLFSRLFSGVSNQQDRMCLLQQLEASHLKI